ncbi:crossover junction endodeoxyribonuclease RuvC [Leadbettera azotonutricia]|uniref:Crossover junction endodeoxyribonuclease RuvC n=1 Tax=Leadbettera azotonutricia (strain ATCC BAA-888 / DSM 13862 / ZAS-9) TaxID=545695 RepID=F5YC98_LEAAZ|nr:crossover junction endodeoxyribonuclease RuvC [Leadbettera azotonutricia]AEF81417.1 crossover junction endodeoxyribonuclease RuvC [Leadbettera azotonutricia ZAS-9]
MGSSPSKKSGLLKAASDRAGRRILGVDPGLASTGWGVIDYTGNKLRYIAHGCIETEANRPRAERLFFIYRSFVEVLKTYTPAEAAIENLYFGKNVSSAMAVAEARGVLCMALAQAGLPVLELTPNAIKKAVVGESSAGKAQVQEMVRFLLGLTEIPRPDHAADALGAAVCAAHSVTFG